MANEKDCISSKELEEINQLLSPNSTPQNKDPELENFIERVENVTKIISGLNSKEPHIIEKSLQEADLKCVHQNDSQEDQECKVKSSRTIINKSVSSSSNDSRKEMSQEGFMRMVERDAEERAENRRRRKEKSDELVKRANRYFSEANYAPALEYYNQAIKLIKDLPHLYLNRALTYIRLQIYSKAIEDCDNALKLNEKSLKARLFKAKALFLMGDSEGVDKCIAEAKQVNPESIHIINDYVSENF